MKTTLGSLAGFVLAFAFLISSGFLPTGSDPSWPPHPRAIVNWIANQELGGDISLESGEERVIFTVPEDRWLVLTEVRALNHYMDLIERSGGVDVVKLQGLSLMESWLLPERDIVGLTFQPGSELVIRNSLEITQGLGHGFHWNGYFTR